MEREIYQMVSECNDKGWVQGNKFMETPEEALKMMRDWVAYQIWLARRKGIKVTNLHVWEDTVLHTLNVIPSQSVTLTIGDDYWEFRVSACLLHDKYERPSWW